MTQVGLEFFVKGCSELEAFVRCDVLPEYSPRIVVSVFTTILKEIIEKQPDPQRSLEQIVRNLEEDL